MLFFDRFWVTLEGLFLIRYNTFLCLVLYLARCKMYVPINQILSVGVMPYSTIGDIRMGEIRCDRGSGTIAIIKPSTRS